MINKMVMIFWIICVLFSSALLADDSWKPNGNAYGRNDRGEYGCGMTDVHTEDGKGVLVGGYTFTFPARLYFVLVNEKGGFVTDYTVPACTSKVKHLLKTDHDKKYIATGWIIKNGVQTAYLLKIKIEGKGKKRKIVIDKDWGTHQGFAFPGGSEYLNIAEIKNPFNKQSEYIYTGFTGSYPQIFLFVGKTNHTGTKVLKKWTYTKDNPIAKTKLVNYSIGLAIIESPDKSHFFITGGYGANVYIDRTEDIYDLDYFFSRAFLLKIDTANGALASLWREKPEETLYLFTNEKQPQLSIGYDMTTTGDNEILITGTTKGKPFLQKFDANGFSLWKEPKVYDKEIKGQHKEGNQVHYYKSKKDKPLYIITGYTKDTTAVNGNRDVLSLTINPDGILQTVNTFGYDKYPPRWDDGISVNRCPGRKVCSITPQ